MDIQLSIPLSYRQLPNFLQVNRTMTVDIRDKKGVPIHVGDYVKARFRQGQVEAIFTDNIDAPAEKAEGREIHVAVKHPPKVVFTDQRGNQVSHNPTAIELENVDKGRTDAVATESQFEEKKRNETGHEKEERENVQVSETQTEEPKIIGKDGVPIHAGETVETPYRGGIREGEVEAIFAGNSSEPVEELPGHDVHVPIINPPKVIFTTQRDKQVSHNPSALSHTDSGNM